MIFQEENKVIKSKKLLSVVISAATITFMSVTTFASVAYNGPIATITKSYVDSNTYTTIASPTKYSNTTECDLKLSTLYKADGSSSNYKVIKAKFYSGSIICTGKSEYTSATLGTHLYPVLKKEYQAKGTKISFKAMGNNPALDCQVSGFFSAD